MSAARNRRSLLLATHHYPNVDRGWIDPHGGRQTYTHSVPAAAARSQLDMEIPTPRPAPSPPPRRIWCCFAIRCWRPIPADAAQRRQLLLLE